MSINDMITPQDAEIILSVSEISQLLKQVVETTFSAIKVRGEIVGAKTYATGHTYLSLKDENDVISAVVWKGTKIPFKLEDGLEIIAKGRLSIYSGRSTYQLIIESAEIAGEGALLKLLMERKAKLEKEGLFDASRKKEIPKYPRCIGVVTSPQGAVIRDIIHRLKERFPARVLLWPAAVQGENSAAEVAAGIEGLNSLPKELAPDVIIVARGGGSLEDLFGFNEEIVVRAAANSRIPLISAVGHETDTTLIDYAADLRAPTPTAAAELATPSRLELIETLAGWSMHLTSHVKNLITTYEGQLLAAGHSLISPSGLIDDYRLRLDDKFLNLQLFTSTLLEKLSTSLKSNSDLLESYSFKNTLARGFAIAYGKDGQIVSSKKQASSNSIAAVGFTDGTVTLSATIEKPKAKKKIPPESPQGQLF